MSTQTETLNIVIREDGSRVVVRNIGDIGGAAKAASSTVDLLKASLASLVAVLAVDKIIQYADAWANANGLIAIATKTQAEAAAVTDQLFLAAQRTRSGFNDVVNVYSAAARAASLLGASQADTIKFTEGLGQALAVQHVSAETARGALLQLGQLLDSGQVRAQEFNSVLLGTPVILQTVAKGLGDASGSVSRLRAQMLSGKLTSQEFFQGFLKGLPSLQADFAKAAFTFGQGFTLIGNAFEKYIGELNTSLGLSQKFGQAARAIASNMDQIASAVLKAAETIAAAVATVLTFKAAIEAVRIGGLVADFLAYSSAIAAGTVVQLGSAEAERQRTAAALEAAAATEASTAAQVQASVATATATATSTAAQVANVAATQAAVIAAREDAVAKLARANAEIVATKASQESLAATKAAALAAHEGATLAGAQSFAIKVLREAEETLTATYAQETIAENTLAAAEQARVIALRELAVLGTQQARLNTEAATAATANAAAQTALNDAQIAAGVATTAAATNTARAAQAATTAALASAGTTTLFGQALNFVRIASVAAFAAMGRLFVLVNTNPFIVITTAIVAAIGFLLVWGNNIKAGVDKITTLNDVVVAFGQTIKDVLTPLGSSIAEGFRSLTGEIGTILGSLGQQISAAVGGFTASFKGFFSGIDSGFAGALEGTARVVDAFAGLFTGLIIAIGRIFGGLPSVILTAFQQMFAGLQAMVIVQVNLIIDVVNKARGAIGASLIEEIQLPTVKVDENAYKNYGKNIANSIEDGFDIQGGFAEKFVDGVVQRAQKLAAARDAAAKPPAAVVDLTKKPPPGAAVGPDEKDIKKTTDALRVLENRIDSVGGAQLDLSKDEQILIHARQLGLISIQAESDLLVKLIASYQDQLDPLGKINRDIDDQTRLLGFNVEQREVESQVLEAQKSLRKDGIVLSAIEIQALRDKYTAQQQLNQVTSQQDQILQNSVGARKNFQQQLQAIQNVSADPTSGFTSGDKATATVNAAKSAGIDLDGTQVAIDAQLDAFKNMYAQIDLLRKDDLISAQDAEAAKAKIAVQAYNLQTKNAQTFFGDLSSLTSSGNKKLFEVGKAAAIANAVIQGESAVMNALATPPWYVGIALAVAAAAKVANQIAQIKATQFTGYMEGGYTGGNSASQAVGIVHGQEYVIDAANTSRLGVQNLDALREGTARLVSTTSSKSGSSANGGPALNVTVMNYGTSKTFETQQLSPTDVRLIARDEASQQISDKTPKLVAAQLNDPNSQISKGVSRNTNTARRR